MHCGDAYALTGLSAAGEAGKIKATGGRYASITIFGAGRAAPRPRS
jgi:hypothetical protein